MRETLRFETNVPQVVALAFDKGLAVEGRYGDQVMFTLEDDRVMYVPPIVETKLRELGIRRGEDFQLCKREAKHGNRRSIEWAVEPVNGKGPAEPTPSQAANQKDGAAQQAPHTEQSITNGNGAGKTNGKDQTHVSIPYTGTEAGNFLLSALVNSVDIWLATQQYARAKGLELAITTEDVRALAITAFINTRGGR